MFAIMHSSRLAVYHRVAVIKEEAIYCFIFYYKDNFIFCNRHLLLYLPVTATYNGTPFALSASIAAQSCT